MYSYINIRIYFYNNSIFMKLENTDYLNYKWINKYYEKTKNILIYVVKTDKSLGMT